MKFIKVIEKENDIKYFNLAMVDYFSYADYSGYEFTFHRANADIEVEDKGYVHAELGALEIVDENDIKNLVAEKNREATTE